MHPNQLSSPKPLTPEVEAAIKAELNYELEVVAYYKDKIFPVIEGLTGDDISIICAWLIANLTRHEPIQSLIFGERVSMMIGMISSIPVPQADNQFTIIFPQSTYTGSTPPLRSLFQASDGKVN